MRRVIAAVVVIAAVTAPAYAATSEDEITIADIEEADRRRRAVAVELNEITEEYDAAINRVIVTEDKMRAVAVEIAVAEQVLVDLRVEASEVARTMYMEAGAVGGIAVFDAGSINDIPMRTAYLESLSAAGEATLARLMALEGAFADQRTGFDELLVDQEEAVAELDALALEILDRLAAADAEYRALVAAYEAQEEAKRRAAEEARRRAEEEARRLATSTTAAPTTTTTTVVEGEGETATTTSTTAPPTATTTTTAPPSDDPPAATGGRVCPVDGAVSFTDTWGAPRSGGRTHKGVDMIAARGTPLVAIENGVISRMRNGGLGGITLWIAGISGDSFYYAHLDGYAPGLSRGQSVTAGELVGYVGNTGNARYTVPHLHFEYHPGGGSAINPYPLTAGLCF